MICAGIVAVYSIGWFIRQQRTQQPCVRRVSQFPDDRLEREEILVPRRFDRHDQVDH